jgi:single-strand DNA-binding protein
MPREIIRRITMFNGATVTLAGYVATEPYYRTLEDKKTPIMSMRVAWTSRFRDRETGEWRDGNTSFANVKCWRQLANNAAPSFRKGDPIVLAGRLHIREYQGRDGGRRIAVDIDAESIGHDVNRGISVLQRTPRSARDSAEGLNRGEAIRSGLTDDEFIDGEVSALSSAGEGRGEVADGPDDTFNVGAVGELAAAADEMMAGAAPF